jgi:hypothetical protein
MNPSLNEKIELALIYASQSNWSAANSLLAYLPGQFDFNVQEQEVYNYFTTLSGIMFELHQSGLGSDSLSSTQITSLQQLADNYQDFAAANARNILINKSGYEYIEPIILPDEGLKSGSFIFDMPVSKDYRPDYISIYPNPAMNYIIVELNQTNISGVNVNLFDNNGKLVKSSIIPAQIQDYVIGLKDLRPGIYVLKAEMNGKDLGSRKLSIVK